jgi:acylphosphatase
MPIQAILVVSGKVQSVGYREYVYHQATRLNLTGLVRNIDEGKVWAVVEGEKEVIEQFKRDIWTKDAIAEVTDIRIDYGEAKGCYDTFLVTRDLRYNGLPESKMEEGIVYLKKIVEGIEQLKPIVQGIEQLKPVVEGINGLKTELGGKIDRMDANMAGHFERLDAKYGEFGDTMNGMAADIKEIRKAATKGNGEQATG